MSDHDHPTTPADAVNPEPGVCPDCGHLHAGPSLAGICVGCPCPTRPGVPAWRQPIDCSRCATAIPVDAADPGDLPTFLTSKVLAPTRPGYTRPDVDWRVEGDKVSSEKPFAAFLCRACMQALARWVYLSQPRRWQLHADTDEMPADYLDELQTALAEHAVTVLDRSETGVRLAWPDLAWDEDTEEGEQVWATWGTDPGAVWILHYADTDDDGGPVDLLALLVVDRADPHEVAAHIAAAHPVARTRRRDRTLPDRPTH
jgi:hypothetical protein